MTGGAGFEEVSADKFPEALGFVGGELDGTRCGVYVPSQDDLGCTPGSITGGEFGGRNDLLPRIRVIGVCIMAKN